MLKALCESSDSRHEVADKVHDFVARFNTESKYNVFLKRRRDKIKAELGMFVSVINPDKMFDTLKVSTGVNSILQTVSLVCYLMTVILIKNQ